MSVQVDRNPFEFGSELGLKDLVDRADELAELQRVGRESRKHFLIGPRRFGKSSLLAAMEETLGGESGGPLVLRYDAERFSGPDQLASRLVADAAARLPGPAERIAKAVKHLFRRLRPELSYNPATQTWSASLGVAAAADPLPTLVDALDGVERMAKDLDRPIAVVLDEFQCLVERGVQAEGQIRAAIQQHRHVAYVFAGSDTRLLAAMVGEASRPFYRLGSWRFLGPVPREAFAAFLSRGLANVSRVTDEGITAILDLAEDVPYNVQLLAHACWEAARGASVAVTREFVANVNRAAAQRYNPVYSQVWSSLTGPQQRTLLAVIHEGDERLTSTRVARSYGLPVTTIQRSRQALVAKHVLREEASGARLLLRLEDPLFGAWLRLVIPRPV